MANVTEDRVKVDLINACEELLKSINIRRFIKFLAYLLGFILCKNPNKLFFNK